MKSSVPGSAPRAVTRAYSRKQRPVYRIIIAQLIATLLASALCLFFGGVAALSALLGGLVCILPNAFLARRLGEGTASPGSGMKQLLYGEFGRLGLTVVMFGAIFILVKPLDALSFFGTFVGLQAFVVLVPLWDRLVDRGLTRQ